MLIEVRHPAAAWWPLSQPPAPCAQAGDGYALVPGSEFSVARTALRSNESHYYINKRKVGTKEVTDLLKTKGIDLDNNRFLILQVRSRVLAGGGSAYRGCGRLLGLVRPHCTGITPVLKPRSPSNTGCCLCTASPSPSLSWGSCFTLRSPTCPTLYTSYTLYMNHAGRGGANLHDEAQGGGQERHGAAGVSGGAAAAARGPADDLGLGPGWRGARSCNLAAERQHGH